MGLTPEVVARWVQTSCERQGVPMHVTDPGTLERVAVLLGRKPSGAPRALGSAQRTDTRDTTPNMAATRADDLSVSGTTVPEGGRQGFAAA